MKEKSYKRVCVYVSHEKLALLDGIKQVCNLSRGSVIELALEELTDKRSLLEVQKLLGGKQHVQ